MVQGKQDEVFGKKPEPGKAAEPVKPPVVVEPVIQPLKPEPTAVSVPEVALVVAPGQSIQEIEMSVDVETKMLEVIRQRQKNKKELIKIAIQQTNEEDWVLQGGKPYLEITGAEKIAPIFGVRITGIVRSIEEGVDADGDHVGMKWKRFRHEGTGQIAVGSRVVYELQGLFGSSSTKDDFFGKDKNGFKPIADIDMRDLEYKSYSDLMRVAVVRLVGLRSVTVDELTAAGLKIEKIKDVQRGAPVSDEDAKKQEELLKVIKGLVGTDDAKVRAAVKHFSIFVGNDKKEMFKDNATQLTGKWLDSTLKKAKAEAEKVDEQGGGK
jgi:hypothetical protein